MIIITIVQSSMEQVVRAAIHAQRGTVAIICGFAPGIEIKTKKI